MEQLRKTLRICIALVWVVNGLYCKLLGGVPRHEQIVARILGPANAGHVTKLIGVLELLMAVWIMSRIKPKLCAAAQIAVVMTMNVIELLMAEDLLLFGAVNIWVAAFFVIVVAFTEFYQMPPAGHNLETS